METSAVSGYKKSSDYLQCRRYSKQIRGLRKILEDLDLNKDAHFETEIQTRVRRFHALDKRFRYLAKKAKTIQAELNRIGPNKKEFEKAKLRFKEFMSYQPYFDCTRLEIASEHPVRDRDRFPLMSTRMNDLRARFPLTSARMNDLQANARSKFSNMSKNVKDTYNNSDKIQQAKHFIRMQRLGR